MKELDGMEMEENIIMAMNWYLTVNIMKEKNITEK